jgi:hypothetical protein
VSSIPSITTSILAGMRNGFGTLDRGAAEIVDGTQPEPDATDSTTDSVQTGSPVDPSGQTVGSGDELLSGVRDLMVARLQIGGAVALLHAYNDTRQDLFEMLK